MQLLHSLPSICNHHAADEQASSTSYEIGREATDSVPSKYSNIEHHTASDVMHRSQWSAGYLGVRKWFEKLDGDGDRYVVFQLVHL
jgi:hypothetical protein